MRSHPHSKFLLSPRKTAKQVAVTKQRLPIARSLTSRTALKVPGQMHPADLSPRAQAKGTGARRFSAAADTPKLPQIRPRAESDAVIISTHLRDLLRSDFLELAARQSENHTHFRESQVGTVLQRAKPRNQDSSFYVENSVQHFSVFGVCDGHGQQGHFVSGFLSTRVPEVVTAHVAAARSVIDWSAALTETFRQCSSELQAQLFDSQCSGSTCVCVVLCGGKAICANVGDSRAVLGRKQGDDLTAVELSKDHKPDVPEEFLRIIQHGGRIDPVFTETGEAFGPPRVWFHSEDFPGLAMSRVFGDTLAASIGIISVPGIAYTDVTVVELTPADRFIIAASDGVWEFVTSQEAVSLVGELWSTGQSATCCKALIDLATKRWRQEEDCVDDITVVVVGVGQ